MSNRLSDGYALHGTAFLHDPIGGRYSSKFGFIRVPCKVDTLIQNRIKSKIIIIDKHNVFIDAGVDGRFKIC